MAMDPDLQKIDRQLSRLAQGLCFPKIKFIDEGYGHIRIITECICDNHPDCIRYENDK